MNGRKWGRNSSKPASKTARRVGRHAVTSGPQPGWYTQNAIARTRRDRADAEENLLLHSVGARVDDLQEETHHLWDEGPAALLAPLQDNLHNKHRVTINKTRPTVQRLGAYKRSVPGCSWSTLGAYLEDAA